MHELSIVEALIEQVQNEVERANHTGRVIRLDLVVGRLSGAHADAIRFAFELLAPGTLVEAATLHIDQPAAGCLCRSCGARSEIDDLTATCPVCGAMDIAIDGGQDLLLQSIELDE